MISDEKLRKVKALQVDIEEAKQNISEWKGQQKEILKQLKEQFEIASLEEAEQLVQKLQQEQKQLEIEFEKGFAELENEFDL